MTDPLTRRQREVLEHLREHYGTEEGELVHEGRQAFLGSSADDPVAPRTVFALLRLCAITPIGEEKDRGANYYEISGTGKKILDGDLSDLELIREKVREAQTRRVQAVEESGEDG